MKIKSLLKISLLCMMFLTLTVSSFGQKQVNKLKVFNDRVFRVTSIQDAYRIAFYRNPGTFDLNKKTSAEMIEKLQSSYKKKSTVRVTVDLVTNKIIKVENL